MAIGPPPPPPPDAVLRVDWLTWIESALLLSKPRRRILPPVPTLSAIFVALLKRFKLLILTVLPRTSIAPPLAGLTMPPSLILPSIVPFSRFTVLPAIV